MNSHGIWRLKQDGVSPPSCCASTSFSFLLFMRVLFHFVHNAYTTLKNAVKNETRNGWKFDFENKIFNKWNLCIPCGLKIHIKISFFYNFESTFSVNIEKILNSKNIKRNRCHKKQLRKRFMFFLLLCFSFPN